MSFRIDPVGAGTAARLFRIKPVSSRRDEQSEDREERRQRREDEEEGASYAPAPKPLVDAYGPRVPGARVTAPASGATTPTWVAALLKAR